jgi:hypothetical protein
MLANAYSQYRLRLDQETISQSGIDDFTFNNSNFRSTHLALKLLRRAVQNTPANDDSPLKLITMETTARYSARTEGD